MSVVGCVEFPSPLSFFVSYLDVVKLNGQVLKGCS